MKDDGKINWRKIASVDFNNFNTIISTNDNYLDEMTNMIAFCSLENEFVSIEL